MHGRTWGAALVLLTLIASLLASSPAHAAPGLQVDLPQRAFVGTTATLRGEVVDLPDPAAGTVTVARRRDGDWVVVSSRRPSDDGRFSFRLGVLRGRHDLRVRLTHPDETVQTVVTLTGARAESRLRLGGPSSVVDGRRIRLTARWRTQDGRALTGRVRLERRRAGQSRWHRVTTVKVRSGSGSVRTRPRRDLRYRLRAGGTRIVLAGRSGPLRVDNRPPGTVFRRPSGAPRPRVRLPRQRRAYVLGANASVSTIPGRVWRSMKGRSWHRGCPVSRSSLRLVRTSYYAYDGYRRRGVMVVHAGVAKQTRRALRDLYRAKVPIRSMYRVDRFGWSRRLNGANDMRSMAAGNSSAFNCRSVVGAPGRRSPHALGRSIDLNTWENPYRSGWGLVPNAYWDSRTRPRAFVYRSRSHQVVRIMARHGFGWLGSADWQHFQYVGSGARTMPTPEHFHD
ncbi:D-alanyl-D-alanine carboxypeptidase-like protein [Mumia flava]|uniref:D-alanyl-D-alanine carboxypeptidase-like protein n=1 Tax=Mumia flava TaxID=1348852 RepID=A0A2M9BDB3_9ACTN|nr:M15 family metallopeptidase [Mumia flava]PJJ55904.1 D-alanyl-D-alanine carboxypeptidase-like protein [Mumia flava]